MQIYYTECSQGADLADVAQKTVSDQKHLTSLKNTLNSVWTTVKDWYTRNDAPFYAVTDADIAFLHSTPGDVLAVYAAALQQNPTWDAAAPALLTADIPHHFPLRAHAMGLWPTYQRYLVYHAGRWLPAQPGVPDTQFALYRKGQRFRRRQDALRLDCPYCARHLDWYLNPARLTPDVRFNKNSSSKVIGTFGSNALRRVQQGQSLAEALGDKPLARQGFAVWLGKGTPDVYFYAEFYQFWHKHWCWSWQQALNVVLAYIQAQLGASLQYLDLGAGTGANAAYATMLTWDATVVDYEEHYIKKLQFLRLRNPAALRLMRVVQQCLTPVQAGAPPPLYDSFYPLGLPCTPAALFVADTLPGAGPALVRVDTTRVPLGLLPALLRALAARPARPFLVVYFEAYRQPLDRALQASICEALGAWPHLLQVRNTGCKDTGQPFGKKPMIVHTSPARCEPCVFGWTGLYVALDDLHTLPPKTYLAPQPPPRSKVNTLPPKRG